MTKIAKIIEPEFRSGIKNGKEWRIMKVELEDGTTATGFAPASEGDEVEVSKNEYGFQFKTTKKKGGSSDAGDDVHKYIVMQLKKLSEGQDEVMSMLTDLAAKMAESGSSKAQDEDLTMPPNFLED